MHFKRFFEFKPDNNNNLFIIFNNNKVLFDLDQKTFVLNASFLSFQNYDFEKVGIAEDDGMNIYSIDISNITFNFKDQGYSSLVEYDLRHMLPTLNNNDISLLVELINYFIGLKVISIVVIAVT